MHPNSYDFHIFKERKYTYEAHACLISGEDILYVYRALKINNKVFSYSYFIAEEVELYLTNLRINWDRVYSPKRINIYTKLHKDRELPLYYMYELTEDAWFFLMCKIND